MNFSKKGNQKSHNLISSNLNLGIHSKAYISELFYNQSTMKWVVLSTFVAIIFLPQKEHPVFG